MSAAIDTTNAPRIWRHVGRGMRVRVIDPNWLEQQRALAVPDVVAPEPAPLSDIPFADVSWAERAVAYRQSVAAMAVPACHRPMLTAYRIIAEVAEAHGVKVADIKGPRRLTRVVLARQEAMWRLKSETPRSYPQIGLLLGNRDHTTVLHGVRQHQKRIDAGQVRR